MKTKTMNLKLAMTADLTDVPRVALTEEEETSIQAARTVLLNRLLASTDTVADVLNRHNESYKYDRIIGINQDGQMVMLPLSCNQDACYHAILLSDLRSDKFLFYLCSAPVAQTGENKVRAMFVPHLFSSGVGFPPDCDVAVDEVYIGMADITGTVRVKCSYIQSYYGRLSNAYITSVFVEGDVTEGYCVRVLEGEVPVLQRADPDKGTPERIAAEESAVAKAREKYTTPDGKRPTTYEEAIAHIWS